MPKGVMWRQEDIFFAAMMGGNPYGPPPERPEDVAESARARGIATMLPAAPLIHGAAQWATFIALYGGGKVVIAPGKRFDPDLVWRLAAEEKVNSITIVGDAMARPLAEALERLIVRTIVTEGNRFRWSNLLGAREGPAEGTPAGRCSDGQLWRVRRRLPGRARRSRR